MHLVPRALESQEGFKKGRDQIRFDFKKIPLAAMWWVDQSREIGWERRGIWCRKSFQDEVVGKEGGGWWKGQSGG